VASRARGPTGVADTLIPGWYDRQRVCWYPSSSNSLGQGTTCGQKYPKCRVWPHKRQFTSDERLTRPQECSYGTRRLSSNVGALNGVCDATMRGEPLRRGRLVRNSRMNLVHFSVVGSSRPPSRRFPCPGSEKCRGILPDRNCRGSGSSERAERASVKHCERVQDLACTGRTGHGFLSRQVAMVLVQWGFVSASPGDSINFLTLRLGCRSSATNGKKWSPCWTV
jgi:hypothetical protein